MEGRNPQLKTPTDYTCCILITLELELTKSRIGKSLSWILGRPSGILITKAGKTLCSILEWFHLHFIFSNSSWFTFWSCKLDSSSNRSYWTGIWTDNSNGSWTDKHSSHFSTAKEISVKAIFFSCKNQNKQILKWSWMTLKSFWTIHLQMMNRLEPLF